MNELEIRGLKSLIKEVIEDETDINTKLADLEESVADLEAKQPEEPEDEPEEDLPEEETLEDEYEDNPERKKYDKTVEKANEKLSEGARVDENTMKKLQKAPAKQVKKENAVEDMDDFEEDFNNKD